MAARPPSYFEAGVAFQRGGRHALACRCFRKALDSGEGDSVAAFRSYWNLSQSCVALGDDAGAEAALRSALALLPPPSSSNDKIGPEEPVLKEGARLVPLNLSALLARRAGSSSTSRESLLEEALGLAERGLAASPFDPDLAVQQGGLLRRLGRQAEALERAWSAVAHHRSQEQQQQQQQQQNQQQKEEPEPPLPESKPPAPPLPLPVHVLMVKWGPKYPSDHANRLARAVRRHVVPEASTPGVRVLCLTDDACGLDLAAIDDALPLPAHATVQGWWAKACLFSPALPVPTGAPILYLDLDTVITGDLGPLLRLFNEAAPRSGGALAALGTESLQSEGGRRGGVNTSMMLWRAHDPRWTPLYADAGQAVRAVVRKFDWWVEMVAAGVEGRRRDHSTGGDDGIVRIQERWPGVVLDYQTYQAARPEEQQRASAVAFPLQPKPADLVGSVAWIREHWR